jgi:hypothetical protein
MTQSAAQQQSPHDAALALWDSWVKRGVGLDDLATGAKDIADRLRALGDPTNAVIWDQTATRCKAQLAAVAAKSGPVPGAPKPAAPAGKCQTQTQQHNSSVGLAMMQHAVVGLLGVALFMSIPSAVQWIGDNYPDQEWALNADPLVVKSLSLFAAKLWALASILGGVWTALSLRSGD